MDLIKKHYEKVLLGVVLLGLVMGAAFLPLMIASERRSLNDKSLEIQRRPIKPLATQALTRQEELIKRAETPLNLDFSTTNRLFNPQMWQRAVDGRLVKPPAGGLAKLCQVTAITPLYTTFTLEGVQTNEPIRYVLSIVREAAANPGQRGKRTFYPTLREKREKEGFTIVDVKGPPDNPEGLILELSDSAERVSLAKDKPFRRVDGYMADLKYENLPDRWSRTRLREGDPVGPLGGEKYIIVAIHKDEVTLLAESNKKKTPIPYNSGP